MPNPIGNSVTHQCSSDSGHKFLLLDLLRFCTAMLVVLFHYELFVQRATSETRLFGRLDIGVDLFFILSGFVITHTYHQRLRSLSDYLFFLQRRLARVYPLHLLMLLVTIVMVIGASAIGRPLKEAARYDFSYLLGQFLLTHAWGFHDRLTFNNVSWSISAEWFVYLLFPLLWMLARRLGPTLTLISLVIFVAIADWSSAHYGLNSWNQRSYDYGIIRATPSFVAGLAIWQLWTRLKGHTQISALAINLLGLLTVFFVVFNPMRSLTITLFAMLILALALREPKIQAPRLDRVLRTLGDMSYGLYMVHPTIGILFFTVLEPKATFLARHPWLTALLAFGLSLAISYLLFRFFERPLRERFGARRLFPQRN
jgi:peptidoglycan/LPS O-acetylase OafA/YrhL